MPTAPSFDDILRAAERIRPYAHRTPVVTCAALDHWVGARVFLKCENLQKVGAFKFRGAANAVLSLTDAEAARGVATHSSGNHAQALALAARLRGIPAAIVMPRTAPAVKKAAVAGYGARITFCEPTLAARESTLEDVVRATGAHVVHPYDDDRVIAGQGTAAFELLEDVPGLDVVMTPVEEEDSSADGDRRLLPRPGHPVIAAEPLGANDAWQSLRAGRIIPSVDPRTIADGLLTSLSDRTFAIIQRHVERIVTVGEPAIVTAMKFVWERAKLVIEPSAAVPIGALRERAFEAAGLRIGVILSGGNVDLDRLPWLGS